MMTRSRLLSLVAALAAASIALGGCAPAAAPAPTAAPAPAAKAPEPAKPVEPTKAPAAPTQAPAAAPTKAPQPTAAPAKTVDFPQKGKTISIVVPFTAGGGTDMGARALAAAMEKVLGSPVQVVNKAGGGTVIGNTEVVNAKPDGYTLLYTSLATLILTYSEPNKVATYTRANFMPVAFHSLIPLTVTVKADSPLKSVKDLVDAAKANPDKIAVSAAGQMTIGHLAGAQLQQLAGIRLAQVFFPGSAEEVAALMGGHVQTSLIASANVLPHFKSGAFRVLAIQDKDPNPFFPGVPTLESQGYKIYFASLYGIMAPAGTPKEISDVLDAALKKSMDDQDHQKRLADQGFTARYLDATGYGKLWSEQEDVIKSLLPLLTVK